jgi:hypothetical protein
MLRVTVIVDRLDENKQKVETVHQFSITSESVLTEWKADKLCVTVDRHAEDIQRTADARDRGDHR